MVLRTDAQAVLQIDGVTVLDLCDNRPRPGNAPVKGGDPGHGASISLERGWHAVRLEMEATGRDNGLEWWWVRPDGMQEIVPPSRLRYTTDSATGTRPNRFGVPSTPLCASGSNEP
jgi:hypothetical protein